MKFLSLPSRSTKPRESGLTIVIDRGLATRQFEDIISSHSQLIDLVKLGWGTAAVTARLEEKIEIARWFSIPIFFGGTFFEKALIQGKLKEYRTLCRDLDLQYVEISNGTVNLPNDIKGRYISEFASEFLVLSEVGYKDEERSSMLPAESWIDFIKGDLEAGALKVIIEARESGKSGICRKTGELRYELVEQILDSGVPADRLIFEAPNKELQLFFIRKLGANVNFANISPDDVISVETLRLGLRSDTLELFEDAREDAYMSNGRRGSGS